mmetsp:Transcript_11555/g.20898  ORF Transcript_11555/g.20898 Transcript_11555/m.20898 type:complete len:210 (-) Transcript_11555:837-1466(-)
MPTLSPPALSASKYPSVCFIHSPSIRSLKSSRACAPRLSLRCSALRIVTAALMSRFSSSSASSRSVFHTMLLSSSEMSPYFPTVSLISATPCASVSCVRNTAALVCITFCISRRMAAVGMEPFLWRSLSTRSMVAAPAPEGSGLWGVPGLVSSSTRFPHARPNTTMSSSELAPRRLAPCTEAQAASPAAKRPGTVASGLSCVGRSTSPW